MLPEKIYYAQNKTFARHRMFADEKNAELFVAGHGYLETYELHGDYYYYIGVKKFGDIPASHPPLGIVLSDNRFHKFQLTWLFAVDFPVSKEECI